MPAIAPPTARPMTAVSEIGVSSSRSGHFACRPRVRANTLPPLPTSTPATNASGLASSSPSSASRTASIVRKISPSGAGTQSGSVMAGRGAYTDERSTPMSGGGACLAASTAASILART